MFQPRCFSPKAAFFAILVLAVAAGQSDAQFRSHPGGHGARIIIGTGSPYFFSPFYGSGWPYYSQPYFYSYSYGSSWWYYSQPTYAYYQPLVVFAPNPPPEPGKPRPDNAAKLEITLPEAADLWVDGKKSTQSGNVRSFVTPPLMPGQVFFYDVRATWTDKSGAPATRTRTVEIYAGQQAKVNLMLEN